MTPPSKATESKDDWARVKALFEDALDQPSATRREWLARAAGGDEALLREAQELFESLDTAGGFLEQPLAIDPADLEEPPEGGPHESPQNAEGGPYDSPQHAGVGAGFSRLGPYRVIEEIGRGGMGVVYLAEDERLKRRVALKLLSPAVAANPTLRERLRREARAAATISHPSVAVVYALEEIDEQLVLVSEYIPGTTLREAIAGGPLPEPRALAIAADIARALAAAHDAGVIHRDLKPENVVMTPGGAVKVVDFGIAHMEGEGGTRLTVEGALLGTPAYMAPEQLVGDRVDPRADIYAAGIVLAEMLTGRHPLTTSRGNALPAAVEPVITRAIEPDPKRRYGSARELLSAIEAVAGGLQASGRARSRPHAQWWWEFHQAIAAMAYSLAVIPAWTARGLIGGATGRTFFIITLAAVIIAAGVRLHLWFTSRSYPGELPWVQRGVRRLLLGADCTFALALVAGSLIVGDEGSPIAVVLLSIGVGAAVAFLVIEPATTRAAFRSSSAKPQS